MLRASSLMLLAVLALGAIPSVQAELESSPTEVVPAVHSATVGNTFTNASDDFRIVPYGAFWADMIYATSRTYPGAFTFYVLSEESQGEDALTIDARRSRFGFNAAGPAIPLDGGLQSGGQLEIDFHGDFIIENRAEVLLRQAYWEAKNDRRRFLVGQYWDVISPLNPRMVNYSVGWLAGNIGFRRAQFRYETFGAIAPDLAWVLQTSLNQDIVPDFPTDPDVVRESSNWPVFEVRIALTLDPQSGMKSSTLGLSGHIGETGFDFLEVGPPPLSLPPKDDARFETWSYNIDLSVPIGQHANLQAEFFRGRDLSPFLGGVGQGICPCARRPIDSIGGWADVRYDWTDWLSTVVGYGVDDPDDDDLLFGRVYNQFLFANFQVQLTDALSTGLELSYWKTLYKESRGGLIPVSDLRPTAPGNAVVIDWMMKYAF